MPGFSDGIGYLVISLDVSDADPKSSNFLLTAAIVVCALQFLWFAPKCINQIDYDGMTYIGIARHLHHGEFHAAISSFRSPLLSWLIAGGSFIYPDYLHLGKAANIASFLLTAVLLYFFSLRLWRSKPAASGAVLLFVLARGYVPAVFEEVTPDFLFAALALIYFLFLLRCLRDDRMSDWFWLGAIHGLAYLAKAFALPWLTVCTVSALALSARPLKTRVRQFAAALLVPVIVAAAWATVLHSKYGVFTTGTQFKANLLEWTLHAEKDHPETTYALLRDTSRQLDEDMVDDPMPPGSWPWTYRVTLRNALPKMLLAEVHLAPRVIKELLIVATPGAALAFFFALCIVSRRRKQYPAEWKVATVITVGALTLIAAYSTLVFDGRYLFPLVPLLLAVALRFLVPDPEWNHRAWRITCVALAALGVVGSIMYSSSPFRVLTRDFYTTCYSTGKLLSEYSGSTVISIGEGPFPDHGVGWEAGYKSAYFGQRRLIAAMISLPNIAQFDLLDRDLQKANSDAVLVWGKPGDPVYTRLVQRLLSQPKHASTATIDDPVLGEVGTAIFYSR